MTCEHTEQQCGARVRSRIRLARTIRSSTRRAGLLRYLILDLLARRHELLPLGDLLGCGVWWQLGRQGRHVVGGDDGCCAALACRLRRGHVGISDSSGEGSGRRGIHWKDVDEIDVRLRHSL